MKEKVHNEIFEEYKAFVKSSYKFSSFNLVLVLPELNLTEELKKRQKQIIKQDVPMTKFVV